MASSSDSLEMTPAQRMMAQHAATESHQPTVEEVEDETDIADHSLSVEDSEPTPMPAPNTSTQVNGSTLSEKAAGKQRVIEQPAKTGSAGRAQNHNVKAPLDTQSEEAFPSLAAPKVQSQAQAASMWGQKPSSISNRTAPGSTYSSSNITSRSSTPPATAVNIPGRHSESVSLASSQLKPRSELKKPIQEILRDSNRRSKARVEMSTSAGTVTFRAQGPNAESVRQALKDITAQVGAKQVIKVPIPASARPHIIGRQGATIQQISKRSGARVHVPRSDSLQTNTDDDDTIINVEIEGDPVTAALARREIDSIVNQRSSTVNSKLRHVPAEYFPFIAGAHNSRIKALQEGRDVRINIPQYHTWQNQRPPQAMQPGQGLDFRPQEAYPIQIAGDREAVRQVQAEIDRHVAELQQNLALRQIAVERERHQFVVGDRGSSIHDFLAETGCSVILPPSSDDSETVTIVGPPDQVENAITKVVDLASSMAVANVDVVRQFPQAASGAQDHARDLTRYLQQRQAFEEFERLYDASIVTPTAMEGSAPWQIYAREGRNSMRARADVMELLSAHPPSRFRNVDLHPFYQQELRQQHAKVLRDTHGVHLVFPEDESVQSPVLLVYEGSSAPHEYNFPRSRPSANDIAQFETALAEVENFILALADAQDEIVQHSLDAPNKYREKVQKYIDRETQSAAECSHPIQFLDIDEHFPRQPANSGNTFPIKFRGPSAAVEDYKLKLNAFIQQQLQEEAERGYTTSCDFPQRFTNVLIGKKGDNINKIRDEFDVELQVQDGKVEIKGPKAKADAARAHIIAMSKRLEDETTHVIKIKPQFHAELIGSKGSQVIRLQDKCKVRINFPRNSASPTDDQSLADGGSETGASSRPKKTLQAVDEIYIRGPKRGADEARDELLSLYQYLQDNSHMASISVARSQLPSLIGLGGRELDNLRLTTGASIDVPGRDEVNSSERVEVKVKGTKAQCEAAKKLISDRAKVFDANINRSITVEQKHHRALIGREGENIRQLIADAGGSTEPRDRARLVQFPKVDSGEKAIRLEGNKDVVEKLIASIQSFVDQRDQQVTETVIIPPERHGVLIGRRGDTRKGIEKDFSVSLLIPSTSVTGPDRSAIRISGLPQDVAKAKDRVLATVKGQEGETILVPRRLHHAVADTGGNFFQNLKRDLNVTVDHAGQQKPARVKIHPPASSNGTSGASLPLITDGDIDNSMLDPHEHHIWNIVNPFTDVDDDAGNIPFVLRGSDANNVAEAKLRLENTIAAAEKSRIGFLVLPDPRMSRHVVGAGGSTVNKIRRDTGCKIDVPKTGKAGDPIEITGEEEALEQARKLILEAISKSIQ